MHVMVYSVSSVILRSLFECEIYMQHYTVASVVLSTLLSLYTRLNRSRMTSSCAV